MWQEELVEGLKGAQPRERRDILKRYSVLTGFSHQHLYRIAKEHGFDTGRSRADKGVLKSALTDEQIGFLAALMRVTGRETKGPIMPVERALQIAVDNGIIEEGQAAPGTINRILRERRISKMHMKAPAPHTEMRSLHPNHVHAYDVSVCIQYYLKNGRLGVIDERDFYKNKPENFEKIKTRLLRYLVVDHFSGAFHLKYYDTTGETRDNFYDFLMEAWAEKSDEKLPFHGVPFLLLMDNGAANKARATVAMLERLGVEVPKGRPYNPRKQGAVETIHSVIEEWFESGLRLQPAYTVEQLNAWAVDFMAWFQATQKHTRHKQPRFQRWMQIRPDTELRLLPADDLMQDLFANPEEECLVNGDYSIRFRGNRYYVKHVEGVVIRGKILALLTPLKWPRIDVSLNGRVYEANPIEQLPAHLGGFSADAAIIGREYKSQPETITQQAMKRMDNMAYGEERKKGAIPFEGLQVFGHHADKVEGLSYMPKTGTPIEVDRKVADKSISMTEFFKKLQREIGTISQELNRELRARHGESIDVKEAEEVINSLIDGKTVPCKMAGT